MGINVFEMFAKLSLDSSAFQKGLNVAKSDMQGLVDATGALVSKTVSLIGDLTKKGLSIAENALTGFIKSSVETTMNFEQAIAGVSATLGQGSEQVIGELRDFALKMGEETQYTATQAAEALNYMALAGYDAEKSMRVLPNVLNLAAAGGFDLARASDMVTDASSALQLSEEQTTKMIDQMAKASSKSNTSIEQLGDAMLAIGGTAKDLKGGTAELATVLGILADNGMKGAEGGTQLRNIMKSLISPTGEVAKAFYDEHGISLFDSVTGDMRSLNDVFLDLSKAMGNMGTGEKKALLSELFDARSLKAAEALLAGAGDRFNELMADMANAEGSAEEMRRKQEDTLKGQVTIMQSALEGLKISIGRGITPALKDMATFGADAFQLMNKAYKNNGLTGLFQEFERWIPRFFNKIHERVADFQNVFQRIVKLVAKTLPPLLKDGLMTTLAMITDFANTLTEPEMLDNLLDAGGELLMAIVQGVFNSWNNLARIAARVVTALANYLEKNAGELVDTAVTMIQNFVKGLVEGDSLGKIVDGAIRIVQALATAITSDGVLENLIGAAAALVSYIVSTATDPETVKEIVALAGTILDGLMNALLSEESLDAIFDPENGIPKILSNIIENIGTIASFLITFAGDLLVKILSYFIDPENKQKLMDGASNIMDALAKALLNVVDTARVALREVGIALGRALGEEFDGTEPGETIVGKILNGIAHAAGTLLEKWGESWYDADITDTDFSKTPYLYDWLNSDTLMQYDEYEAMRKRNLENHSGGGNYRGDGVSAGDAIAKERRDKYNEILAQFGATAAEGYREANPFALGGIVTRPVHALIGEAGAEAVIPLERNSGWIDGVAERITERMYGGITIHFGDIYVSGDEDVGKKVTEQIDLALRELQIQQARGIGGTAWKR